MNGYEGEHGGYGYEGKHGYEAMNGYEGEHGGYEGKHGGYEGKHGYEGEHGGYEGKRGGYEGKHGYQGEHGGYEAMNGYEGKHGYYDATYPRPRGARASSPGAPGVRSRRSSVPRSSGGASAVLTAATAAACLGRAAGAGELSVRGPLEVEAPSVVEIGLSNEWKSVVITVTVDARGLLAVLIALAALVSWAIRSACSRGRRREPKVEEKKKPKVEEGCGKPKSVKKDKVILCDAGVMGPVHYNGARYIHAAQGFRRADEVTREVAEKPHRD